MTTFETLSIIVSAAGFIGLVVSIRYLISQTKHLVIQSTSSVRALEATTFDATAEAMFLVDRVFIEYPEIRKFFYDGAVPMVEIERHRAAAVAELLLDQFDYLLLQQRWFPFLYPANFWREYMHDSFAASPTLSNYLETRKHWYSDDLHSLMTEAIVRTKTEGGVSTVAAPSLQR